VMPDLNSFFAGPDTGAQQSRRVIEFLARSPQNAAQVLVTHQVNISALTQEPSGMGEILLVARPRLAAPLPTRLRVLSRWTP
jgi:hypothetical protein